MAQSIIRAWRFAPRNGAPARRQGEYSGPRGISGARPCSQSTGRRSEDTRPVCDPADGRGEEGSRDGSEVRPLTNLKEIYCGSHEVRRSSRSSVNVNAGPACIRSFAYFASPFGSPTQLMEIAKETVAAFTTSSRGASGGKMGGGALRRYGARFGPISCRTDLSACTRSCRLTPG
jgi:hypothetical protein